MAKALLNKKYIIQKMQGKGGWSYVVISGIPPNKKRRFGFVRVSGSIDNYQIEKYNLMPMKAGTLFLPIKAEIRKAIKKKEGDTVHVILYEDNTPLEIPEELTLCLKEEPKALKTFHNLSDAEQKHYLDWIYSAKKEETKIERIAAAINKLLRGEKLYLQK